MTAIDLTLRHCQTGRPHALKTDLWNEGVGTNRDVMGRLEHDKKLSLFGIDVSAYTCGLAKIRLKDTSIANADLRSLPFKGKSFDAIFDLSTIDHVPPNQIPVVLGEYQRILKESGLLLMFFWYESMLLKLARRLSKPSKYELPPYRYYLSVEQMRLTLRRTGFSILNEYCTVGRGADSLSRGVRTGGTWERFSKLVYSLVLNLEYSPFSSLLLRPFGGFFVVIGKKCYPRT